MERIKGWMCGSLSPDGRRRDYYFLFTMFFCATAFLCFFWFLFSGKSLIWKADGWTQHFKALVYYAEYLRKIFRTLFTEGRLIVPEWDFYIGEGSDILNALHYYVIGDPIVLPAVFVPTNFLHYFFSFSCILRLYLAGIAFSAFCFGMGKRNRLAILTGALTYSFCTWAIMGAARHPYFVNPMIALPLMLLGIEKILRKEKPYLFIVVTALSSASNFYFFYIIVLLAVLYTLVRLFFLYIFAGSRREAAFPANAGRPGSSRAGLPPLWERLKKAFVSLLHLGLMALIGIAIAGVLFLPMLFMFLGDSRISIAQPFHLFYPLSYYSELPGTLVSGETPYWMCMGFTAPCVLALIWLFLKKGSSRFLRTLVLICLGIMLLPIGGRIFNGMSYMVNRWCFAFALLSAYILVCAWDELFALSKKEWRKLGIGAAVYMALCLILDYSRKPAVITGIVLLLAAVLVLRFALRREKDLKRMQVLMFILAAAGSVNVSFWLFAPFGDNYIEEFVENGEVWSKWEDNEYAAVKDASGDAYTRMSGRSLAENANIFRELSSTQYYWSISSPYVNRFRTDLAMRETMYSRFMGYDDRTAPLTLSGVLYYSVPKDSRKGLPFGFSPAGSEVSSPAGDRAVYKNDYALPLVYSYGACFSKDFWDSCNPAQKQQALLEAAFAEEQPEGIAAVSPELSDHLVLFDVKCIGKDVSLTEDGVTTTAKGARIVLTLRKAAKASEIYVGFEGLAFAPTAGYDLYFGDEAADPLSLYDPEDWDSLSGEKQDSLRREKLYWNPVKNADILFKSSAGTQKTLKYRQPDAAYSSGRDSYLANLGYQKKAVTKISITFSACGRYSFDSLRVYAVPMKGYRGRIAELGKYKPEELSVGGDEVCFRMTVDETRLLCLAIPFSKGWEASVDGAAAEVYCLNDRYLGIVVPPGGHRILFRYHRPFGRAGFVLTILGFAAFLAVILLERRVSGCGREQ